MPRKSFTERFNAKWLKDADGCHIWQFGTKGNGYGFMRYKGKDRLAHRIAWEEAHGEIPAGIMVCHHCDKPSCVNVAHLFLGTQSDNMRDMVSKNRHPYVHGEKNAKAKLTDQQAIAILNSTLSSRKLAAIYGVSKPTILNIKNGFTYRNIHQ